LKFFCHQQGAPPLAIAQSKPAQKFQNLLPNLSPLSVNGFGWGTAAWFIMITYHAAPIKRHLLRFRQTSWTI
jgi:hypothetical protein